MSGVQLIGFADDLAVVEMAVTEQQLEDAINPTLTVIDNWMRSRGLELSHQKTETVILSRRRAFVPPRLTIGGHLIPLQNEIKYFVVILDKRLTFTAHAVNVATKAARSAAALSRLMPNISGPAQWKRRLLTSVVESQLLYAAPVWIPAIVEMAKLIEMVRGFPVLYDTSYEDYMRSKLKDDLWDKIAKEINTSEIPSGE
ncbi:hypothetical protein QTP88_019196 [Uroleucon formosanum]